MYFLQIDLYNTFLDSTLWFKAVEKTFLKNFKKSLFDMI